MSNEIVVRRRAGRMNRLTRALLQRKFVELLLNSDRRLSKSAICAEVGIASATYDAWAADATLVNVLNIESWRIDEMATRTINASQQRAIETLNEVMLNSRNDIARVRAAELMLQQRQAIKALEETKSSGGTQDLVKLLSAGPTFVFAHVNMLPPGSSGVLPLDTEEIIEGVVREIA